MSDTLENNLSPSRKLAAKVVYAAMNFIKECGGEAPAGEVMVEVEKRVTFNEWEKEVYEKTGVVRWKTMLRFFTIDCVKTGFLIKKKGVWYLTPEGEKALDQLDEIKFLAEATRGYRKWASARKAEQEIEDEGLENDTSEQAIEATLDEVEQKAIEGIKSFIQKLNAYEFQDLAAALLRGMGYYTPFVAPKGKDGGIDIMAYKDPLGTETPRMKVQIKHRQDATSVKDIRELMGLLQKDGDIGIFISTGGFSSDAKITARTAGVHLELVDMSRFIELWQSFYGKMSDEDKALLPLTPIYFLAPTE